MKSWLRFRRARCIGVPPIPFVPAAARSFVQQGGALWR